MTLLVGAITDKQTVVAVTREAATLLIGLLQTSEGVMRL